VHVRIWDGRVIETKCSKAQEKHMAEENGLKGSGKGKINSAKARKPSNRWVILGSNGSHPQS
jgi:hypothetical protein